MRISDWSSDVCSSDLDVRSVAVYAVPDEIGDRVMVALELRDGTHLDPLGFDDWLRGQPDLGTKWLPSYVRVDAELPQLSSMTLETHTLPRAAWTLAGVLFRPTRQDNPSHASAPHRKP